MWGAKLTSCLLPPATIRTGGTRGLPFASRPLAQWIEQRVSRLRGKDGFEAARFARSSASLSRVLSAGGSWWQETGALLVR